jgi:hypothetical protein
MRDEDVRDALRTELAERTPPPPRGGLAEVVGRGRRRRRTQQLGAAFAVAVAFAGTAVVASALGEPNASPPASTVTTTPSPDPAAAWPTADLPPHTPYTTWTPGPTAPPPAGRPIEVVPKCSISDISARDLDTVRVGPDLQQRVVDMVRAVTGGATVGEVVERNFGPTSPGASDSYVYLADITDADGTGSMEFSAGSFSGDPLAAADEQAFLELNCDPPKRHVLPDGTVLQIYARQPNEPFQSLSQVLRVYRPGGELFTLTVLNYGTPDFAPDPDRPGIPQRVGAGRATLPLTEGQLGEFGIAIATG